MLVMLVGNILQIALWAWLFEYLGEFADFNAAFYHSAVNFATLGYGDVVMSEARRLLGALEAVNGVLMFGLTTGLLFAILNELLEQSWQRLIDRYRERRTPTQIHTRGSTEAGGDPDSGTRSNTRPQ
jgi:hypothetical protein